jgi:DNA invertase Pin-like site-specific DNA recombinase
MMQEKDKWDTILVVKMDRIHRNSRNFMEMMDNLRKWGKEFASMQESLDTSTAMGRFVVDIIQRIAQLESEQTGERVYIGMKQKAKTVGGILGFNIPYGYDYIDGKLIVKEKEAKVVKEIFEMYLDRLSMKKIADKLNLDNVPTKQNKKWASQTISSILRNPLYCGFLHWEDHLQRGDHSPLIDINIFNKVQKQIMERKRNPNYRSRAFNILVDAKGMKSYEKK